MKTTNSRSQFVVGCIIVLMVAGATAGLFLTFSPDSPRDSYWLVMADVLLMELFAGGWQVLRILLSTGAARSAFPIAMHFAIDTTLAIFLVLTATVDTLFLTVFDKSSLDVVLVWIVVWKWILMVVTITGLWFAGLEGRDRKPVLEGSRKSRSAIRSKMEQARSDVRHLRANASERAILHQVTDDLDSTYNRVVSWSSRPPAEGDATQQVAGLVDDLARAASELSQSPEGEHGQGLVQVQRIAREITARLGSG